MFRGIVTGRLASRICLLLVINSVVIGCNGSGLQKLEISGEVTYQGQPIPLGWITFQPDKSKGNGGPQGYAKIKNGKFTTSSEKGVVPGAQRITVYGYSGDNPNPEYRPYGDPMFPPHFMTAELPEETSDFAINVP